MTAARKLDERRVRDALSRVLAPTMVARVLEEARGEDEPEGDARPTAADLEEVAARLRRGARRRAR